jgi:hypothetical protein
MRARLTVGMVATLLALVGASASAAAATHPRPDPSALWREYPLGTQPLETGTAPAARTSAGRRAGHTPRATEASSFDIGLTQLLIATALLCTLAAVIPVAVRRRPGSAHPLVHRTNGSVPGRVPPVRRTVALPPPARNGELMDGVVSATRDVVAARPPRPARPPAARDDEILRCAAAYAEASRRGDAAPMAAVRAIVPAGTADPAAHAKRAIAAARRRGLLTSRGRGKAGGELTPKAVELLRDRAPAVSAAEWVERAPAHEPAVARLRADLPVLEHDGSA